jgi:epidermal growth factor receptor substrate 15
MKSYHAYGSFTQCANFLNSDTLVLPSYRALADTKTRGALDSTDFIIGMYLIQASMSSPSLLLPATLPSWLYDQAAQNLDTNATVASHATGGSASALASPLQSSFQPPRIYAGSGAVASGANIFSSQHNVQQSPQTPSRQSASGFARSSASPPVAGSLDDRRPLHQAWSVSPEAKASSDTFFDGLDSQRRGYIEGDVAVPFMLESKLPKSELAQIW